jgi:YVTN family beta-propeller protein
MLAVAAVLVSPASAAQPHYAYVVNENAESVSVIDTQSQQVVGTPIAVGIKPSGIAITPDGKSAYVTNWFSGSVSVIDTQTFQTIGSKIAVGEEPGSIAITPDGMLAYVSNVQSGTVSVIDLQTNQTVGKPITVGANPGDLAITPDGNFVYVTNFNSGNVSVIRTQTNYVVATIPVGVWPDALAVTPDGSSVYVANLFSNDVSVIDTQTMQVAGEPIIVGPEPSSISGPSSIAISPDGSMAYIGNESTGSISVIDTQSRQVIGKPIQVGSQPSALTFSPGGKEAFVTKRGSESVAVIDTQLRHVVKEISVGDTPADIAVAPAQPPIASFSNPRFRPKVRNFFEGSISTDPDGQFDRYDWSFGDGLDALNTGPAPSHVYSAPGTYSVALTVTDNEGCSTALIFTGRTAYCNGSPKASQTRAVTVAFPAVRVKCPLHVRGGRCRFKLWGVTTKRKRGAVESIFSYAKVKRGASAIVSIRPRAHFSRKLAIAKRILIRGVFWNGSSRESFVQWFRVVR